ncbi:sugar ABC transporter substrate-binding protein [Leucobacter celer]|uniref:sugar ABC transporter substrate-binding protein n=1 Tax=Leucobacter celer TaxID=668625 RepID=UPI0006A7983E|nr:sugar ABC transporter substrate-binding protein [Leucobacter celer]
MRKNTQRRVLVLAATAATAALALTGCSGGTDDTGGDGESGEFVPSFAFITGDISDFGQVQIEGMESVVEPLGGKVTVFDSDNAESQNSDCMDIVSSGQYNGIMLNALSGAGAVPCAEAAAEAGIPVVAVETVVGPDATKIEPQVDGVIASAVFSNEDAGMATVELLKEGCADFDPCKYIHIVGSQQYELEANKLKVIERELGGDSKYERVALGEDGYNPEQGRQVAAELLSGNPDANVILNSGDSSAVQVISMLEEEGRDDIVVLGDGASRQGVEAIKAGTLLGTTRLAPRTMGEVAATALVQSNRGEDVISQEEIADQLAPIAFTADNIGDFEGQWG